MRAKVSFFHFCVFFLWVLISSQTAFASRGISLEYKNTTGGQKSIPLYQNSHALLIGVSDYQAGWPDLESIPGEIRKLEETLEAQGFEVTTVIDPDSRKLQNSYEEFIDRYGYDQQNRLLMFFSGHGYSRMSGTKGYLVPKDAPDPRVDEKGFLRKALNMSQILTWARQIESKHALFLFDSCFSGTLFKTKALPKYPPHIGEATSRNVRQFITAGSAGEEVPAQSVFVPSFLKGINGEADLNEDGYVTGTELGMFLHNKVLNYATGQTPQYGKIRDPNLDEGDFVFINPNFKQIQPEPVTTNAPENKEATFWAEVKDSENVEMLALFIERYPNSSQAALARIKIDDLQKKRSAELTKRKAEQEMIFWESVKGSENAELYRAYLDQYPEGKFSSVAKIQLESLNKKSQQLQQSQKVQLENQYWDTIKNSNNAELFRAYLKKYPKGQYVELAKVLIIEAEKPAPTPVIFTSPSSQIDLSGIKVTLLPIRNETIVDRGGWKQYSKQQTEEKLIAIIAETLTKNKGMYLHSSFYDHPNIAGSYLKTTKEQYDTKSFWKKDGFFSAFKPNADSIVRFCNAIGSDMAIAIRYEYDLGGSRIQTFIIDSRKGVAIEDKTIVQEFGRDSKELMARLLSDLPKSGSASQ